MIRYFLMPVLLQGYSSGNSILQLVGLVILLIVIIVASYFTTKYIGGKQLSQQKNSNFKVLDTYRLTQNKYLQLIKVGKKYIVIAVGKDFVTELAELSEEEVLYHGPERSEKSFKEILTGFGRKKEDDLSGKTIESNSDDLEENTFKNNVENEKDKKEHENKKT